MSKVTADSSGVWMVNVGSYRLPDPESGTVFEPGVETKATRTEWSKGQPTLQLVGFDVEPVTAIEPVEPEEPEAPVKTKHGK